MRTPVEIDFQGMHGRPEIRASIEKHVAGPDDSQRTSHL
jgi:hypothetical protein